MDVKDESRCGLEPDGSCAWLVPSNRTSTINTTAPTVDVCLKEIYRLFMEENSYWIMLVIKHESQRNSEHGDVTRIRLIAID